MSQCLPKDTDLMINALSGLTPTRLPADLTPDEQQWAGFGMPETTDTPPAPETRPTAWRSRGGKDEVHTALLNVTHLPRELRATVESAMVVCILSPAEPCAPGTDLLNARWFTAWHRCRDNHRRVGCREQITGTTRELGYLQSVLFNLAREHDFTAEIRILD